MSAARGRFIDALNSHGGRVTAAGKTGTCPAHQDRNPSLSIAEASSFAGVVIKCQAGCHLDDVLAALSLSAADLFDEPRARSRGYEITAEYPYTDESGQILFVQERRFPKDFRVKRPVGSGWTYKLGDARRVLYRLPEVLAAVRDGQTVYVVEGEADADALAACGLTATCNPLGAGKWQPEYGDVLAGADVVVIADRDTAGYKHAADVDADLAGKAASVRVVEPIAGKDISDHLGAGHGVDELQPVDLEQQSHSEEDPSAGQDPPRKSQATRLVELALDHFRLLLGGDGRLYGVLANGPNVALPLRGRGGLRERLAKLYADRTGGTVPSASALADALAVLEGHCRTADPEEVVLRLARHGDAIVLDLGTADGRCILIDAAGWRSEARSPVLFRRTTLTSPIPDPRPDGSLDRLRELLNVDDDGWHLLVGWAVAALIPELPHPILALLGEQGTAKSTTARVLVELIDPSPAPLRSCPRDIRQWAVTAAASWTVALDNVSTVPPWLSDTLCKAVTGDGIVDRALYTDDDVSVLSFRRVIAMTSIDAGALAGDLAERLLPVELARIPPGARRTDAQIAAEFTEARPALLGALLDLLSAVLEALPSVRLRELPRMADFGRVLAAIDQVLGWDSLTAYGQSTQDIAEVVVESDPFAVAVRTLAGGGWSGTATELLDRITPERPTRGWPRTARAVAGALRRLVPALRSTGVDVGFERTGNSRTRTIVLTADDADGAGVFTSVQVIPEGTDSAAHLDTTQEVWERPSAPSAPAANGADLRKHADDRADANRRADVNRTVSADDADAKDDADATSHSLSGLRSCLGCGRPLAATADPDVVSHDDPYCLARLPAWAAA